MSAKSEETFVIHAAAFSYATAGAKGGARVTRISAETCCDMHGALPSDLFLLRRARSTATVSSM